MAPMLKAERTLRDQVPLSGFDEYACQPGRSLDHEAEPGRPGAANAGSPVVR